MSLETRLYWFKINNPTNQELQIALLNQSIHNYFDKKFNELEQHFCNHIMCFGTSKNQNELIDLYVDITNEIYRYYPKALSKKLKSKQKIHNHHQFN